LLLFKHLIVASRIAGVDLLRHFCSDLKEESAVLGSSGNAPPSFTSAFKRFFFFEESEALMISSPLNEEMIAESSGVVPSYKSVMQSFRFTSPQMFSRLLQANGILPIIYSFDAKGGAYANGDAILDAGRDIVVFLAGHGLLTDADIFFVVNSIANIQKGEIKTNSQLRILTETVSAVVVMVLCFYFSVLFFLCFF
jgi:hypothetical protein